MQNESLILVPNDSPQKSMRVHDSVGLINCEISMYCKQML